MEDLEKKSNILEQEIKKARKDFMNIGLALHFTGELIGPLTSMIGGWFIPSMKYHDLHFDLKYLLGGLGFYALSQGAAFVMKGISLTKEENKWFYEEWKDKGTFDNLLAKFHKYYSERDEKNLKVLEKYSRIKDKLF